MSTEAIRAQEPHTVDFDWLNEARAPIIAYLDPTVRALVAGGQAPEAIASGVLATYRGHPVLLTAKHALDGLESRPLLLELPERFERVDLLPHQMAMSASADAAVVLLPAAAFGWGVPLVNLEVQHRTVPQGEFGIYVAMGFPWRRSFVDLTRARLTLESVNYWGFENEKAYRALGLSRSEFVTTSFDPENAYQEGVKCQMGEPEGMSGGALWRLTENSITLAGILIEYSEKRTKCAVSARVSVLQALAARLTKERSAPRRGSKRS